MKTIYIMMIVGILIIGIATAGTINYVVSKSGITAELTKQQINDLIDCGLSGKYKFANEICIGRNCQVDMFIYNKQGIARKEILIWQDVWKTPDESLKKATESKFKEIIIECKNINERKVEVDKHRITKEDIEIIGK